MYVVKATCQYLSQSFKIEYNKQWKDLEQDQTVNWQTLFLRLHTMSEMRASDELSEEQVRQMLFDLEQSYTAFNRLLQHSWWFSNIAQKLVLVELDGITRIQNARSTRTPWDYAIQIKHNELNKYIRVSLS